MYHINSAAYTRPNTRVLTQDIANHNRILDAGDNLHKVAKISTNISCRNVQRPYADN